MKIIDKYALWNIARFAPRDSTFARETVAESLGITAEELGVSDNDGDSFDADAELNLDGEGDDGLGEFDSNRGGDRDAFDDSRGQRTREPDLGERRPPRRANDQFGRPPKQQRQELPQSGEVKANAQGDLVDARGNVVARRGREARWYQSHVNSQRQVQTVQRQLEALRTDAQNRINRAVELGREMHSELQRYQARDQQLRQFNITPDEQLQALQFAAQFKQNPVQAFRSMMTLAVSRGVDLSQLGVQGGTDLAALSQQIRQEISREMQPLRQRMTQEQQQAALHQRRTQEQNQARAEVEQFFADNPDASKYRRVFGEILQSHPDKSLGEIWANIQLYLATHQQQPTNEGRTRRRGAPPSGRGWVPNGSGRKMAPVNVPYSKILSGVLDEAGIR